jgi:hypothetical protein
MFLLHFFVLIQRNEAKKNQGKPDRSARFAWLAHMYIVDGFVRHIENSFSLKKTKSQILNLKTPNPKPPRPQTTNNKQQTTNNKPQTTNPKQQTTNNKPKT